MQVYAMRPVSLTAGRISRDAIKAGYDYSETEVAQEIDFLAGDKLVEEMPMPGSSQRFYKITSAGIRHYEQNFQA